MGVKKRITYKYAVLIMLKQLFFLEEHASYTVYGGRNLVTVELPYVFVSLGTEVVTPILMESQVELRSMLDHRFIK